MHSVELTGNPLSGAVGAAQIAALRDRGVTVRVLTPDMETRYDIYMVPLDGGAEERVTDDPYDDMDPSWTPF